MPITPDGGWFYADATLDGRRRRLIAVREDHSDPKREPVNTLVSIPRSMVPRAPATSSRSGFDFYSTPRLSPDASRLAWLPGGTRRCRGTGPNSGLRTVPSRALVDATGVAGGDAGVDLPTGLDAGWASSTSSAIATAGGSSIDWTRRVSRRRERAAWRRVRPAAVGVRHGLVGPGGEGRLSSSRIPSRALAPWSLDRRAVCSPARRSARTARVAGGDATHAVVVAGSASTPDAVVRIELATGTIETHQVIVCSRYSRFVSLCRSRVDGVPARRACDGARLLLSAAQWRLRAAGRASASHPHQPRRADDGHQRDARSQGAVLDEPWIRGGRRELRRQHRLWPRLPPASQRQWGIVDVDDMVSRAVPRGRRQGRSDRLVIRGGSAGGYTTLAALTFLVRRCYRRCQLLRGQRPRGAGRDYAQVRVALSRHAHRSRIRRERDVYRARSPIHFVDRLSCPLILFQGLEDKVVPPNQSEMMAAPSAKGFRWRIWHSKVSIAAHLSIFYAFLRRTVEVSFDHRGRCRSRVALLGGCYEANRPLMKL